MFAGGDEVARIQNLQDTAGMLLCGPAADLGFGITDPAQKTACKDAAAAKVTYAFDQFSDQGQRNELRLLLTGWYANAFDACKGEERSNGADAGHACFSDVYTGARKLKFRDLLDDNPIERLAFGPNGAPREDIVSYYVDVVKSGRGAAAVASMASTKALKILTEGLDANQARAARRLYNQAIADPDVDPVKFDKLADYAKALEAIAKQINDFARMPNVDKLYVKDVVPGAKPEDAPTTNAIAAPDELYKPESLGFAAGDTLPAEAIEQLTRLFYEARESYKKQTKTANKDVPEAVVTADAAQTAAAVKEKVAAAKTKVADLAALLNPFTASAQVKDKTLEKVVLSDGAVMGVPAALIAGVTGARGDSRESGYLRIAIAEFWQDEVATTYAEMKPDAQKKVVDALIAQFNGYKAEGNFAGQADEIARAHRIALTRAVSIGTDGTVKLEEAPWLLSARVNNDWRNIAVYRKLKKLYEAAVAEDKGKYEGDEKAMARKNLANAIAARAEQFVLYENYADLPVDTREYSGEFKGRDMIPGMADFMAARFQGFNSDGTVRPLFVRALTSATVAFPGTQLTDSGSPASLSLSLDAGAGVAEGEGARDNGGQGFAITGLTWAHPVSGLFYYGAHGSLILAKFPEMLAPAAEADAFSFEEGNDAELYKVFELWGQVGVKPTAGLDLRLRGGIINSRPRTNNYGLEDSVLWYGRDAAVGSSRAWGVRVDPSYTLLADRLTLFGSLGYKAMSGGIDFKNAALDEDGDGKPDGEEHVFARGGGAVFGSLGGDYVIIPKWWRGGARFSGGTGTSDDEADPRSSYGLSLLSLDVGTGVLFGGSGHALDANYRFTYLGDDRNEPSTQHVLGLHYQGPWARQIFGGTTDIQGIAMASYMWKDATVQSGEDLYGGGSVCTGLSCGGGAGDTSTPGGPVFDIPIVNRALELSLMPKFMFRSDSGFIEGIYVQPQASVFLTEQGSASQAGGLELGSYFGVNLGLTGDFLK